MSDPDYLELTDEDRATLEGLVMALRLTDRTHLKNGATNVYYGDAMQMLEGTWPMNAHRSNSLEPTKLIREIREILAGKRELY